MSETTNGKGSVRKGVLKNFRNFTKNTTVLESRFNKVAGL